jgi:type III pantothenate kinase
MFIAIDIGNTHTVIGAYKKTKLLGDWRLTSMLQRTEDEISTLVKSFLAQVNINTDEVDGVGISSVVPNLTDIYSAMAKNYFHTEPIIISGSLDLGIKIHYDNPLLVGADRLCDAVAGYAKYGGPLIIVDFGTATTYDVIASNGDYLGGVIAPGIETSAIDLHRRAAKLPKIELHLPENVIGTDTISSMQAGILLGAIDAMIGMVKRIKGELRKRGSKKVIVIATGGFSDLVSKQTHVIQHIEPYLVLDGVRLICEKAKRR